MPDNELLAAAERLAKGWNYAACPDAWGECNDARTLAMAYLAERDPTPIDATWLEAVGLEDSSNLRDWKLFVIRGGVTVQGYACEGPRCWKWFLSCNDNPFKSDPTRGDVLRLAAALHKSLTEPRHP